MKSILFKYISFLLISSGSLSSMTRKNIFEYSLLYEEPSIMRWKLETDSFNYRKLSGLILYKRYPILDEQGIQIEPVISIIYEKLPNDSITTLEYANIWMMKTGSFYKLDSLSGPNEMGMKYKYSICKFCSYSRNNISHNLIIVYSVYKNVGIQIICDSTKSIYLKVKDDMLEFIKRVDFQ